jgi:hypothetical protein
MATDPTYDVFLSHASRDKPQVEELARRLRRRRLKPFLDKWHLVPGEPWQEALEEALDQSRTFAIFLGPGALGPWQNEEMRDALDTWARDKSRRVIPVLLPGASMPEKQALPHFLRRLTWVDFSRGLDDPQAFHRLVCGIKGIPPQGGPAPVFPPIRPIMIGVPHRNLFFTGRESLLSRLHQQLQMKGISALAQTAIYGMGGIGKTQTAIEYVYRFGECYRFVLWVVAEEEAEIRSAYLSIARELKLAEPEADLETAVLAVKTWLSREDGWLVVFDNADDPALIRPYLPPTRMGGKIVLTSRAKSFVKVGIRAPLRVETFDPEDAVKFLTERTGIANAQAAAELAAELGHLPLALEQAAAYIESVGGGFAEYIAKYRRQGLALLTKGQLSTDYPKTVATTWSLSFDALRETSPASAELLTATAFIDWDPVPIWVFIKAGSQLGGLLAQELNRVDEDPLVFWELLEPLERYSLVERLPDDAFKMHRLTRKVVKDSLGEDGRRTWTERLIRMGNALWAGPSMTYNPLLSREHPDDPFTLDELASVAAYIDRQLWGVQITLGSEHPEFQQAFKSVAAYRIVLEHFKLEAQERESGSEHPDTMARRHVLAKHLSAIGDLAGARELYEKNMKIYERVLGSEHFDTLSSRTHLIRTLHALDDFSGARKLEEQTLEILERVLGGEHPDTTITTWNLLLSIRHLKDPEAEAQCIDKLRWVLDRDEDTIPSSEQRQIRQLLFDLLNPS